MAGIVSTFSSTAGTEEEEVLVDDLVATNLGGVVSLALADIDPFKIVAAAEEGCCC